MRKKLAVDGKVKIDISCLPDEILSLIFQYCGPPWKEVPSKLMLVNRKWYRTAQDELLWVSVAKAYLRANDVSAYKAPDVSMKDMLQRMYAAVDMTSDRFRRRERERQKRDCGEASRVLMYFDEAWRIAKVYEGDSMAPHEAVELMRTAWWHPNVLSPVQRLVDPDERYNVALAYEADEERKLFWSWLREEGQYTEEDVVKWVNQILEGLQFLESVGSSSHCYELDFSHLFITPQENREYVLQIYRGVDASISGRRIMMACAVGTPVFVAPEVLIATSNKQPQIDMWALGVMLYFLLSGLLPFREECMPELFKQILDGRHGGFDLPQWTGISSEAKDFVAKLLVADGACRLTIEQAVAHSWLTKVSLRRKDKFAVKPLSARNWNTRDCEIFSVLHHDYFCYK